MTVARRLDTPQPERPEPEFREQVAAEIRAQLARRRMSGRSLAKTLGESPTWASRRLAGQVPVDTNDLQRIADVLGMTPMELLAGIGPFGPAVHRRAAPITSPITRVCSAHGRDGVGNVITFPLVGPVAFVTAA